MTAPSLSQEDCFLHMPQQYLVCTTVHKARNLPVLNSDTYVKVNLGKMNKMTKVFPSSENPFYNELSCTLAELLRQSVLFEVKKRSCCKTHVTLGELLVDLHTVWSQPHKSFCRKWGQLRSTSHAGGFLQIDLAIVSPNQPPFPEPVDAANADDIESNLLQNLAMPSCNVKYLVTIYSGVFVKRADYVLQVSLAGMKGKTKVCKATQSPEWREQMQFHWSFPSLSQTFILQVMCHETVTWKCIAEDDIYLDEISFNASPSLGPTFIHFYDVHDYVGRVLIEISTKKMTSLNETIGGTISVRSGMNISEQAWWTEETFVLEFLTWQGEFIHANASNMKISMSLGEHHSDNLECYLKGYTPHKTALKHFTQTSPFKAVHLKCSLPDNRLKYEVDLFILELVDQMRSEMENFRLLRLKYPQAGSMHTKCLKAIILNTLDTVQDSHNMQRLKYNGFKQQTTWDGNRLTFVREFFKRFGTSLKELQENLRAARDGGSVCDKIYQNLQQLRGQVESILQTRTQDEWPELQLHMCLGGGKGASKKFALCKLNARQFVFSQRSECSAPWCGVPRNFVFKDTNCVHTCRKCGCLKGVVYGWLRISTESEQTEFSSSVDWEQKERFYYQPKVNATPVVCRAYVHQAKIQPGADHTGLCDAKLRLIFGDQVADTSVVRTSLSPVWNETVSFAVRQMTGPIGWYERCPLLLPVEMFDADKLKTDDYIGCGLVEMSTTAISTNKDEGLSRTSGPSQSRNFIKTRVALDKLKEMKYISPPPLKWVPIGHMGASRAEILMSVELLLVNENVGPTAVVMEDIPKAIQTPMGKYLLEATFVGLRNCQKMPSSSLGRYRIHVRMGELLLKSGISATRLRNSINFLENFASGTVTLPTQLLYWPPIITTLVDYQGHQREVTLAAAMISDPNKYLSGKESPCDLDEVSVPIDEDTESDPLLQAPLILKKPMWERFRNFVQKNIPMPRRTKEKLSTPHAVIDESEYTWWTKFYNSLHMLEQNLESSAKHKLVIYGWELERERDFSFLTDSAEAFPLIYGVKIKKNQPPREEVYTTLKMRLKLSPCLCSSRTSLTLHSSLSRISSKIQSLNAMQEEIKVMVRVYLVQGMHFRSYDARSQSDSYVKLQLGSQVISDRANYISNQSNPVYGKRFQLPASIPSEHILQISVYDRDGARDDLIGSTFIDLEDRVRSKHRATVGIATEYNRTGYNAWRDVMTPEEILLTVCRRNNLEPPTFGRKSIVVDGVTFEDSSARSAEDFRQRLSLIVLKNLNVLPHVGYRLVPEHVETRALYRPDRPGVEQGKLQLWLEIFDAANVPPPIDITPTPSGIYELRVVVYNCADVPFQERNIFGTSMSDIYIKGWCGDSEAPQRTDVHYRSLTGEGSFNWRMIFPLKYSPAEDMMVIRRKGGFFEVYETKQPPVVYMQIWEDDVISADDFMGALELCLSHFPEPFVTSVACTEKVVRRNPRRFVNLFREKSVRGWFPCRGPAEKDVYTIAGKLELGLEILTDREAASRPAGLGRSPPSALPEPSRPDTSFNPWSSPLKSVQHIIGPAFWKCVRCLLLIALAALLLREFNYIERGSINPNGCFLFPASKASVQTYLQTICKVPQFDTLANKCLTGCLHFNGQHCCLPVGHGCWSWSAHNPLAPSSWSNTRSFKFNDFIEALSKLEPPAI